MYRTTIIGGNINVIMVNNTFNNISDISWRAAFLLGEETANFIDYYT
jgi:hypothetical protein